MADIYTKEKRGLIMSRIKGQNTKPEVLIRKTLFANGYRYRKNVKSLPGKPDIVLPRLKAIILVQGCFWHGHRNCKAAKLPSTNIEFWSLKISQNVARDKKTNAALKKAGWNIMIVWQCGISSKVKFDRTIGVILRKLDRYAKDRQNLYQK